MRNFIWNLGPQYILWVRVVLEETEASGDMSSVLQVYKRNSSQFGKVRYHTPASYLVGAGSSFPGVKRPECEADHSFASKSRR